MATTFDQRTGSRSAAWPIRAGIAAVRISAMIGAAAVIVAWLDGCGTKSAPTADAGTPPLVRAGDEIRIPDRSSLRNSLVVASVESRPMMRTVAAPGVVQADPTLLAKVAPPASGKIQQVFVKLGQSVRKDAALFSLDSPDVDQAIADQARAQSALLLAKENLDRQTDFLEHGISARQDVETAQAAFAQAKAEAARTTARLNGLGYRGENKSDPSILTIRAPADGSVIELTASPGTYVNDVAAPLVTIADTSTVVVNAQLPERDLAYVKVGATAQLEFPAYPGVRRSGVVASISDVVASDTRRAAVLVPLDNRDKLLKPGMFADVQIVESQSPRLVVPTTALLQSEGATIVYVEKSPWVFAEAHVTVDYQQDDDAVIGAGLVAGERVLTKGGILIHGQ